MITKSFNDCTLAYLSKTFALRRLLQSSDLDSWLNHPADVTAREQENLLDLQKLLQFNILAWNEQELALHFIGPVFSLVKLSNERFNLFAERYIEAVILVADAAGHAQEIKLAGRPDGLIATGYFEPETPFFCFHEYKKEIDNSGDPIGQVLAAMLVGQVLNQPSNAIYGCYVIGRHWYFVLLQNNTYCLSEAFEATTAELIDIFRVLKTLKAKIIEMTG